MSVKYCLWTTEEKERKKKKRTYKDILEIEGEFTH